MNRFVLIIVLIFGLSACSRSVPESYQKSVAQNSRIQNLVLHFTAVDYKKSMFTLKNSGAVSAHYLIPRHDDESYPYKHLGVIQLVDEHNRAWHAGQSFWQGRRNLNDTSIGIEIVNEPVCQSEKKAILFYPQKEFSPDQDCQFKSFEPKQIELLVTLAKDILSRHPDIDPTRVVGHADIAPVRKSDPGPQFPWFELYQHGIGAWYDEDVYELYLQMFEQYLPSLKLTQFALKLYGYDIHHSGQFDNKTRSVFYTFQSHFLPTHLTGELTKETAAAVFALLEKYRFENFKIVMGRYLDEAIRQFDAQYKEKIALEFPPKRSVSHVTKTFVGVKGKGKAKIHYESKQSPQLTVVLNGQRVAGSDITAVGHDQFEVSVGKYTRTGNNVMYVKSNVALPHLELELATPELTGGAGKKLAQIDTLARQANFVGAIAINHNAESIHSNRYGQVPNKMSLGLQRQTLALPSMLAMLKLAGEGLLQLSEPVSLYIPEFQGNGREYITVNELIDFASLNVNASLLATQIDTTVTPDGRIENTISNSNHLESTNTNAENSNTEKSNNLTTTRVKLVQKIVEQITGMSFQDYIKKEIFSPLSLSNTGLHYNLKYDADHLMTTPKELMKVLDVIVNNGQFGFERIYQTSTLSHWFQQLKYWQQPVNVKGKQVAPTDCIPYLSPQAALIADQSGLLLLVDPQYQLTMAILPNQNFLLDASRFQCGLSAFQIDVITEVYQYIYQQ